MKLEAEEEEEEEGEEEGEDEGEEVLAVGEERVGAAFLLAAAPKPGKTCEPGGGRFGLNPLRLTPLPVPPAAPPLARISLGRAYAPPPPWMLTCAPRYSDEPPCTL